MPEKIEAYKPCCCSKAYMHKSSALKHEKRCFKNPVNEACLTCKNCVKELETVYVPPHGDENYGDADYEKAYYWCEVYNKELVGKYEEETSDKMHYRRDCKKWIPKKEEYEKCRRDNNEQG